MRLRIAFVALIMVCSLGACKTNNDSSHGPEPGNRPSGHEIPDGHTSQNSLDWEGTYTGTFPCADCEGIAVKLKLNEDLTYVEEFDYLGTENSYKEKGKLKWTEDGRMIKLFKDDNDLSSIF